MLYFAYGSNLLRRRIEERLGPCRLHGIGWLSGYQLRFHKVSADGSGKCNVYRTDKMTDRVHGALFDLSSTQKAKLDEFEGPGYDSVPITVHSDFGAHESETYIAKPASIDPTLIPFDWYKAFVVEGGEEAGLPSEIHVHCSKHAGSARSRYRKRAEKLVSDGWDAGLKRSLFPEICFKERLRRGIREVSRCRVKRCRLIV